MNTFRCSVNADGFRARRALNRVRILRRLAFLPALLIPVLAQASMDAVPSRTSLDFRQLERDIPGLYLLNGLALSADQARKMAAIVEESRSTAEEARDEMDRFLQRNERNLDQLMESLVDQSDSGFKSAKGNPADPQRARSLDAPRHEWQQMMNKRERQFTELAEKALLILTDDQRAILARFHYAFIPGFDFRSPARAGQAEGGAAGVPQILERLRAVPPDKLAEAKTRALAQLLPAMVKKNREGLTAAEMSQLRKKLGASLDATVKQIRTLPDADFELEKARLAERLLPLDEKTVHQLTQAELGKAKIYLLNPGNLSILNARGGVQSPGMQSDPMIMTALQEKGRPFRAAALIGDLQLTPGQARQLIPIVSEAVAERSALERQLEAVMANALEPYRQLKRELVLQQSVPATEKAVRALHVRSRQLLDESIRGCLLKHENRMDRILSADQIDFLIGEKPVQKAKGPAASAADNNIAKMRERASEVFDKVDKLDDAAFERSKHALCQNFIESCVKNKLLDKEDFDMIAELDRAEQVLIRARTTEQFEYARAREDFIAELCPRRHAARPAKFGWKMSLGQPLETLNPTTQLIFSPPMLSLIEMKANRRMKGAPLRLPQTGK